VSSIASVDESVVIEVIDHFRQPGLSLLMPPAGVELYSDSIIEISHESLMRIWTRLKNWVEEENESADMYLRISEAAALYQVGRTGLWRPPDLQLALNWQKKQKPTRHWAQRYDEAFERAIVFLDTSRITYESEQENQELLQKRILRRTRVFAAILGVAAIIAILFGILSLVSSIEAQRQSEIAQQQSDEAIRAQKAADVERQEAIKARNEATENEKLALDAQEATEQALIEVEKALDGQRIATAAAKEAQLRAEDEQRRAEKATDEAIKQTKIAEEQRDLAQQRLMQSIAAALAGKSLRERDSELRGLMAMQAYKYNRQYGGKEFDNMIYDALYYSLANFNGEGYNQFNTMSKEAIKSVQFSGIGGEFYTTGSDGYIYKFDLNDTGKTPTLIAEANNQYANREIRISPNQRWLVSSSDSSEIKIFDLNNIASRPKVLKDHKGLVRDIQFMPDNSGFITLGFDQKVFFYDFNRSRLLKKTENPISRFKISPDNRTLFAGTTDGKVLRISLADMSETIIADESDMKQITSIEISPDGTILAFGGLTGHTVLYDLINGQNIQELYGHTSRISDIDFSSNGSRVITASWDGTIQMWNMNNLDDLPYYITDNGGSYIMDVDFSPDNKFIVVGTRKGQLKKWAIDNSSLSEQICQYLTRNMTQEEWDRYVSDEVDYRNTCENIINKDNI